MAHLGKPAGIIPIPNAQDATAESKRKQDAEVQEKMDAAKIDQVRKEEQERLAASKPLVSSDQPKATTPLKIQPETKVEEAKQTLTVQPVTEGHEVTITPNELGRYKFKAVCTCAWQGLFATKDEAVDRAKVHKDIRSAKPF